MNILKQIFCKINRKVKIVKHFLKNMEPIFNINETKRQIELGQIFIVIDFQIGIYKIFN